MSDIFAMIINAAGTSLPATGGIGTTIFYVIGGLILAAVVVFLLIRHARKVKAEKARKERERRKRRIMEKYDLSEEEYEEYEAERRSRHRRN